MTLDQVIEEHITKVYSKHWASRSKAGVELGIDERTIYNYLKKRPHIEERIQLEAMTLIAYASYWFNKLHSKPSRFDPEDYRH